MRGANTRNRSRARSLAAAVLLGLGAGACRGDAGGPPARLADTGLYLDFARGMVHPEALPYAPQYPLWSDGAGKRRWIRLPRGASIDARDPDAWAFPEGTRFWKEFTFGRRVETRFMELTRSGWRYATYAWTEDGRDAVLVPASGSREAAEIAPGLRHDLPGVADCRACHEGHVPAVLGFAALQLSPDRDPLAPHAEPLPAGAVDLAALIARGVVRGYPRPLRDPPPRIRARTARERAALGYLHANCAGCHNADGPLAELGLDLEQRVAATGLAPLSSAVRQPSRFRPRGKPASERIAPGAPERSVLALRLGAGDPVSQMPPLAHKTVDQVASALVDAWIRVDLAEAAPHPAVHPEEESP
jgi:hypothetical protein